jgi:hypothetical protein
MFRSAATFGFGALQRLAKRMISKRSDAGFHLQKMVVVLL